MSLFQTVRDSRLLRRQALQDIITGHIGLLFPAAILVFIASAVAFPRAFTALDPLIADPLQSLQPPNATHWFGTDQLGRDVFARVIYGARYSVLIGLGVVGISSIIGSTLGLVSGLWRGIVDEIISRFLDIISAFPSLLLALALIAFIGPGTTNLICALGIASIPRYARVIRTQLRLVVRSGYVEQAVTFGISPLTLLWRHVLPHALTQLPVLATTGLGTALIAASGMSFIGMGPRPPIPEWGAMLADGHNYLRIAWWASVWPGVFITLTVVAINALARRWQAVFEGRGNSR